MRMYLFLIAILIPACVSAEPKDTKDDKNPTLDEVFIGTWAGGDTWPHWKMRVFKDGSGRVYYGTLGHQIYEFPAGSLGVEAVVRDLRSAAIPDGTIRDSYNVGFFEEGQHTAKSFCTRDAKLVLGLFDKVIDPRPETSRVKKLWKEQPPLDFSKKCNP